MSWSDFPCIFPTTKPSRLGYSRIWREGRRWFHHRWVWHSQRGPIPDDLKVCHHCDVRRCIQLEHLFLGTQADNIADQIAKGRFPARRGIHNGRAKFTEDDVRTIRARHAAGGVSYAELGREFGTTAENISCLVRRIHWADVA